MFYTPTTRYHPPMFADFSCTSASQDLSQCRNPLGISSSINYCGPSVVGVRCIRKCNEASQFHAYTDSFFIASCEDREIRLVGGKNYGRVEVCGSGIWGTVCSDDYWEDVDAGVVCNSLGFSNYGEFFFNAKT